MKQSGEMKPAESTPKYIEKRGYSSYYDVTDGLELVITDQKTGKELARVPNVLYCKDFRTSLELMIDIIDEELREKDYETRW